MMIPHEVKDRKRAIGTIARLLGRDEAELGDRVASARVKLGNRVFALVSDMSRDELATIESAKLDLPGFFVDVQPLRSYPHGTLAAHLLGYLGEINDRELRKKDFVGYQQGDFIGKYGAEKTYESLLRGRSGGKNVLVDVRGRELKILNEIEPVPGNDLYLTVDYKVQRAAEDMMEGKEGAMVAIDPRSGELLAMVSRPAMNPADFAAGASRKVWRALVTDKHHPLNNRAIQGTYAPGSTYKLFTAAAGIETGAITPEQAAGCPGAYSLGNHTYRCWRKRGHGSVAAQAIVQSCDTYFYKLGVKVGVNRLAYFARSFGLGAPTGIPLSGEKGGLIPTAEWKLKRFGHKWMLGETPSIAIGQGYDLVTPLQLSGPMRRWATVARCTSLESSGRRSRRTGGCSRRPGPW
jgi:penicillin-binding protein 2